MPTGEILSLQRQDINLERRELTIRAVKAKTRTARIIPLSNRLRAVLEMQSLDPAGRPYPPEAFVFGDELGRRMKIRSVQEAWPTTREQVGLGDFQLRDIRHEGGSRFEEAGISLNYVSTLLAHTNLTTTSRYLNVNRRGLHNAMRRYEESRQMADVAQKLHKADDYTPAGVQTDRDSHPAKSRPSNQ